MWKKFLITCALWAFGAGYVFAAECENPPAKVINLDIASTRSLQSPDQKWGFTSVGPDTLDHPAILYVQDERSSKRWNIGFLERDGMAFWSQDSKRFFLRDEFAADDTKIRVFDVSGSVPKETRGPDKRIRHIIFSRIPQSETNLWLYYPQACFALNDSSTIVVVADVPVARIKRGQ